MREVVKGLASGEKVECAARRGGYFGEGSFYAAFERTTGYRPGQIRTLSAEELRTLLSAQLEVNPALLRQRSRDRGWEGSRVS